ncbi:trehalase family glycosidase [Streptomyces sp. NPDC005799]|uniref:MGH1-like glycoside hydrolase domain-containing protein n=1 Tax=Streptomyces sp. NPDC005799 TaxID=3154678 RepID=UPI0033EF9174
MITGASTDIARETLRRNHRSGYSRAAQRPYDYTCPSPDTYPFQWAWDSSYHAIALTHVDTRRARDEIRCLLSATTPTGFLPHMVLWQDDLRATATADYRIDLWQGWRSVTIAPPVVARAAERVYQVTGDELWLSRILPPLLGFFAWLRRHRTSPSTGLLEIYQPDESGLDCSPKYDAALGIDGLPDHAVHDAWHAAMRSLIASYSSADRAPETPLSGHQRFVWNDVLVNTIYADGLACLARLARAARMPEQTAARLAEESAAVGAALVRHCWDDTVGVFYDLDLVSGTRAEVLTASSLFPILLDSVPRHLAERVIEEHLLNEKEFWQPYPVPSVAASEPSYDPDFSTRAIFRGSSWVNLNWYLYWGLRKCGYHTQASDLAQRTRALVAASGTRECYGPDDTAGHGARSFGWSTLVLDLAAVKSAPAAAVQPGPAAYGDRAARKDSAPPWNPPTTQTVPAAQHAPATADEES